MSDYVLFSPVGASDPVRGDHDGPMLHIVRHYKPKKVYLFYTKEMLKNRKTTNEALESFNVEKEEILTDIDNPHSFDVFTTIFGEHLKRIQEENKDSQILVNVSSGTAQMTSALCLEIVTLNLSLKPIQVASPANSSSSHIQHGGKIEDNFDTLKKSDGTYETPNRCLVPDILSFKRSFLKRDIQSLISHYEYRAAVQKIEENKEMFSEDVLSLLKYANNRQNDNKDYLKSRWNNIFNYTKQEEPRRAADFYCILSNKAKTAELSYFVLLLKPLAEYIAKSYLGEINDDDAAIVLNTYYQQKNGWDYIPRKYSGKVEYNLNEYICIMRSKNKEMEVIKRFEKLNEFIEDRNTLAHGLKRIDSLDTGEALKLLKYVLKKAYGKLLVDDSLILFEKINERLISLL